PYLITASKNGYYGSATVDMNQSREITIYIEEDKTPPNAEAGDDRTVDEDMEIELNAGLSSDNIGIINYTWRFADQGKQITLYGNTVKYHFIQPGFYTVTLNVSDKAGNYDTDIVNIIVKDVTKPAIKIVSPGEVVHSRDCIVTCVVMDNVKVERVEVSINNHSWSSCIRENINGYTAALILEKGGNTVYIRATDSSGNVNTTSITVFVETPEDVVPVFTSDTIMLLIGIIFCITLTIILERKPKRKSGL
ncbi:MAG: PKD domain-containing protein, partial [Candidatus Thermoplasmatota archaeon]|nr:PKD domain-containing protein [Candidatus Thermoplasmatota archaeon]